MTPTRDDLDLLATAVMGWKQVQSRSAQRTAHIAAVISKALRSQRTVSTGTEQHTSPARLEFPMATEWLNGCALIAGSFGIDR